MQADYRDRPDRGRVIFSVLWEFLFARTGHSGGCESEGEGVSFLQWDGSQCKISGAQTDTFLMMAYAGRAIMYSCSHCLLASLFAPPTQSHSHALHALHGHSFFLSVLLYSRLVHFASAGLRMSYDAGNAPPLHAPWYVEGSFDVNVYYHGWPDDTEPPTPTQLESDSDGDQSMASTQCSIRTVEYVAGTHGDDPPRLRLYFLGVTDLQLIEPEPSHVAERMAMCFLRSGSVYDDQLHALWELLPHDQPREHQTFMCDNGSAAQAFSFTTGAFQAAWCTGGRTQ